MRNALICMTSAALIAGGVSAQELDDMFRTLGQMDAGESVQTDTSKMAAPVKEVDTEALVKESRDAYVAGEFAKAQQGFSAVIKQDPENFWARIYLRKLLERDPRTAEMNAMDAVGKAWDTSMVLRSYALSNEALEDMKLVDAKTAVDVTDRFPEVDFPEGASAVYQPKLEKIFVRNSCENLQVLEEILEGMDVANLDTDVDQVEIEAKFVEVNEGTLEELGFQWDWQGTTHLAGDYVINDGSGGLMSDALRGSPTGGSPDLPFTKPGNIGLGTSSATAIGGSSEWNTFRIEDAFSSAPANVKLEHTGAKPFDLWISALDQSNGADVLSAPRVTVRNGEEATIRVGELHYYPEVYEADKSEATMLNISYQDFEEKLMGVELAVTPEIDGDQIELELNPQITELLGWQQYKLAGANTLYNHRWDIKKKQYTHPDVVAKLPIFKKRSIETVVSIADGSTIGMGGLMGEKVEKFNDKVPFLGDIPFVGRLFRNEGERAVKRNMLMFVRAKKVTPSGRIDTSRTFED